MHDAAGNLVEETRGGVVVTRRYDGQGRVVELRRPGVCRPRRSPGPAGGGDGGRQGGGVAGRQRGLRPGGDERRPRRPEPGFSGAVFRCGGGGLVQLLPDL
ncbi:RHS repeat protein [Arenimonas fontis]|uniref:RHS repeat protein n=1 Tax=Arenimonas fontis TaxID=2608255 RepID=A0A5B2ZCN8_9GAMM|nr:RHS repeat protein [Arenimonas fontis]